MALFILLFFFSLKSIVHSTYITRRTKIRLYHTMIGIVLLTPSLQHLIFIIIIHRPYFTLAILKTLIWFPILLYIFFGLQSLISNIEINKIKFNICFMVKDNFLSFCRNIWVIYLYKKKKKRDTIIY